MTESTGSPFAASSRPATASDAAETSRLGVGQVSPPPKRRNRALLFLRDIAIVIVSAIVISFLIKTFLIRSFYIPSASMVETLEVNDRIIVQQLEPTFIPISRGDVVVFEDPGGWLAEQQTVDHGPVGNTVDWVLEQIGLQATDSDHLIKRVIGVPGDEVACCTSGRLTINGEPIDEPYLNEPDGKASSIEFDVTVPEDSIWVMGDNRNNSSDSRFHTGEPGGGFVPISKVVGRAILITWPIDRWTWLDNYPSVFEDVPDAPTSE